MLTWMDWLKTPMAAPETATLRFMRVSVLSLCLALIVSIAAIAPLKTAIGIGAAGLAGGLLVALVLFVPAYVVLKNRADNAYLDACCAAHEDGLPEQGE